MFLFQYLKPYRCWTYWAQTSGCQASVGCEGTRHEVCAERCGQTPYQWVPADLCWFPRDCSWGWIWARDCRRNGNFTSRFLSKSPCVVSSIFWLSVFCRFYLIETTFCYRYWCVRFSRFIFLGREILWTLRTLRRTIEAECVYHCIRGYRSNSSHGKSCISPQSDWFRIRKWNSLCMDQLRSFILLWCPLLPWECSSRFHFHFQNQWHQSFWTRRTSAVRVLLTGLRLKFAV